MPSVIFWGSGILKDSFTLAAACYFIDATNSLIVRRGNRTWNWVALVTSGYLILLIKPYILLLLLPCTGVWYFYDRIRRIRNRFFRYIIVPFLYMVILSGSYVFLTSMGDRLGKFSLDQALQTAAITQYDLKQEYYDGNSFDIGTLEPTLTGVVSKFPAATTAGLYRPMLGESSQPLMIVAGLENFFILLMTILGVFAAGWRKVFRLFAENPVLLYSLVFAVMFAFMIGVTTSNFGALVRFKIPLIPLYMGTVMILVGHMQVARSQSRKLKTLR
jgi:hypothetical protein